MPHHRGSPQSTFEISARLPSLLRLAWRELWTARYINLWPDPLSTFFQKPAVVAMEAESNAAKRSLEDDLVDEAASKKPRVDEPVSDVQSEAAVQPAEQSETVDTAPTRRVLHPNPLPLPVSRLGLKPKMPELPPSLELMTGITSESVGRKGFVGEHEVGIIGYAGPKDVKGVRGVIKQR